MNLRCPGTRSVCVVVGWRAQEHAVVSYHLQVVLPVGASFEQLSLFDTCVATVHYLAKVHYG